MNTSFRLRQVRTIAQLELKRVFFSRRSFWVYLLALLPAVIFIIHGIDVKVRQSRSAGRITSREILAAIQPGDTPESVIKRAGEPIDDHQWRWKEENREVAHRRMTYFDGQDRVNLHFQDGLLSSKHQAPLIDAEDDRKVFAGVFQYFYLRLAIFFGCLGIFMNLFRGEMLDKTLHFWFLAPARRETLLAGKYLAGLIASVVIFAGGVAACFAAMLWPHSAADTQAYWQGPGPAHLFSYLAAAALACVGYGSIFLAAGMLLRNPIVPAVILLLWEGINGFLPAVLKKLSVLYYVQALSPVPPPLDSSAPAIARLLLTPSEPPPAAAAALGLLALTALVLWSASRAVRKLEINYGVES